MNSQSSLATPCEGVVELRDFVLQKQRAAGGDSGWSLHFLLGVVLFVTRDGDTVGWELLRSVMPQAMERLTHGDRIAIEAGSKRTSELVWSYLSQAEK